LLPAVKDGFEVFWHFSLASKTKDVPKIKENAEKMCIFGPNWPQTTNQHKNGPQTARFAYISLSIHILVFLSSKCITRIQGSIAPPRR